MNLDLYFNNEQEKPLDNLITASGGLVSIFRTIGVVGDSLSSGEFEGMSEEGIRSWHDMYDYSWGQFMARAAGSKVYNFSQGGMTAKAYLEPATGGKLGMWDKDKICQAYVIALGVNDINNYPVGTAADIEETNDTFTSKYAHIIRSIKRLQPKAKIFLMTIPTSDCNEEQAAKEDAHADVIYAMADHFKHCYVLDFRKYAPVYDAKFKEKFYLAGHLNAAGYVLTAQMVISYIDYIIRHNMDDFRQIGFVGTPYFNCEYTW